MNIRKCCIVGIRWVPYMACSGDFPGTGRDMDRQTGHKECWYVHPMLLSQQIRQGWGSAVHILNSYKSDYKLHVTCTLIVLCENFWLGCRGFSKNFQFHYAYVLMYSLILSLCLSLSLSLTHTHTHIHTHHTHIQCGGLQSSLWMHPPAPFWIKK